MMNPPGSGWFCVNKTPYEFIPIHDHGFSGVLPVKIGSHMVADVTIKDKYSDRRMVPFYVPARLKTISAIEKYEIGPFIAILTSDRGDEFAGNHQNFADIIRTGREMGVTIYVITPQSIKNEQDNIVGFLLDSTSTHLRWIKTRLPIPHVVYNRIPHRQAEQKREMQETIRHIREVWQVPFFNPNFFNKWTLYKRVMNNEVLKPFIPETHRLCRSAFKHMTLIHPVLYLKRIEGKAGEGMMKISHSRDGYTLVFQSKRGKSKNVFASFERLWNTVSQFKQSHQYLIQQGIPLATFEHSPFDVRVLLQKNINGSWCFTGAGVRVAGNSAISTHVPMGGRIENINTVLKTAFYPRQNRISDYLRQTAIKFASYIDNTEGNVLGEMSMDFGLEASGSIWFFEANAKPMKFDEPEIRKLSLRRLVDYFIFLSDYHYDEVMAR